jgi:pimeloyl-ACP methyl ester carboxylesterase
MVEHRIEERAPEVAAPTLVVRGERDPIAPEPWCRDLAARFREGSYAEMEGAAHAARFSHSASLLVLARPLLAQSALSDTAGVRPRPCP